MRANTLECFKYLHQPFSVGNVVTDDIIALHSAYYMFCPNSPLNLNSLISSNIPSIICSVMVTKTSLLFSKRTAIAFMSSDDISLLLRWSTPLFPHKRIEWIGLDINLGAEYMANIHGKAKIASPMHHPQMGVEVRRY